MNLKTTTTWNRSLSALSARDAYQWLFSIALLFFFAKALLPTPFSKWNDEIVGAGGDSYFYVWQGWIAHREISGGNFSLSTGMSVYPDGLSFLAGDGQLVYLLGGALNFAFSPVGAYNTLILLIIFGNFLVLYVLSRSLASGHTIALVSSIAIGTGPAVLLRAYGHPHFLCLSLLGTLLLVLLRLHRTSLWTRSTNTSVMCGVAVGFGLAIQLLVSAYFLIAGLIVFLGWLVANRKVLFQRRSILFLSSTFFSLSAFLAPYILRTLSFVARENNASTNAFQAEDNARNAINFSADLLSFFVQPSGMRHQIALFDSVSRNFYPNRLEATTFLGFPLLIFIGIYLALRLTRKAWATNPESDQSWSWLVGPCVLLGLLSLGPVLQINGQVYRATSAFMPARLLTLMGAGGFLRAPSRLALSIPLLCLPLLVIFLTRLRRIHPLAFRCFAALLLVVAPLNLPVIPYTPSPLGRPEVPFSNYRDYPHSGTVLQVPADCGDVGDIIYQIRIPLPFMGCNAQASAVAWYSGLQEAKGSRELAQLRCLPSQIGYGTTAWGLEELPSADVWASISGAFSTRLVLVDRERLQSEWCNQRRSMISRHLTGLRLFGQIGKFDVYQLSEKERRLYQEPLDP